MDIEYRGANCIVVKSKDALLVVDPTPNVKAPEAAKEQAITLATQAEFAPDKAVFVVDMPGEYEHNDVSIYGVPMKRHIDPDGKNSTAYRINIDGLNLLALGHIDAPIGDDDLEAFGMIDVLILPVGGGGYTLDARDAAAVVRQISPKAVIPTHYSDKAISYEVPQEAAELFFKEMGSTLVEKLPSLKIKNASLPETLTIYELTRS
jgi:L-ascorbate metabolism protein UlaG (beta-lactamase superfamily)